jgi:hypothetical protein
MSASSRNVQNSKYKTKTANKSAILTNTRSKSKQKIARSHQNCTGKYNRGVSYKLVVKSKTIRVLLDSGSSGDLLFLKEGASKPIPVINSLAKQTMHDLGVVLDFKGTTIQIDKILLPMRDIANLQLKTSISRALKHNASFAQEPVSTRNATKRVVEILDTKYEKADIPAIVRDYCSHLSETDREKLFSMLLKFEELFDGKLGDWNLPPVSFAIKEGVKPYHGRAYPIPQIHKAVLMKEIDRLCTIGVLKWQPNSEWALPTFIIPKKGDSTYYFRLPGTKQMHSSETLSDPEDQYNAAGARRLHLCPLPLRQPLIQTWATTPSGWIQRVPRCVLSSSPGENTRTRDSQWDLEGRQTSSKHK